MLFVPSVSRTIVGIHIAPRTLTCSWIHPTKGNTPYELKAYKHMLVDVHPKDSLVLYNPTKIKTLITTFLDKYKLHDALVVLSLSGQGVNEKQVMLNKPTAKILHFETTERTLWHYYCLQENAPGPQSPWYCCGISLELLFQYQLLAIACNINLVQITTPTMALLRAYLFLKKEQERTTLSDYVNMTQLRIRSAHDHAAAVESFGLYLLGKQLYEEY